MAEPVLKKKWEAKERKLISRGDIVKEKGLRHLQFLEFRKEYCRE